MKLIISMLLTLSLYAMNEHCPRNESQCLGSDSIHRGLGAFSILQGHTTQTTTQLNIVMPKDRPGLIVKVIDDLGNEIHPKKSFDRTRIFSRWKVRHLHFDQLSITRTYTLSLYKTYKKQIVKILDERIFKTLDVSQNEIKFALTSCMSDSYERPQRYMWKALYESSPQALLMIGDNVYADWLPRFLVGRPADGKQLWRRYVQTRLVLDIYRYKKLIPIYAAWDDHDFGKNNAGKSFEWKEESLKVFDTFYAQDFGPNLIQGPGISFAVKMNQQNFVYLDNRYFRDSAKNKHGAHLGQEVLHWLSNLNLQGPSYIIQGDQFFGGYQPFESYEGLHPTEFLEFLEILKRNFDEVFFLSGDRHLSELMKIEEGLLDHVTYEHTSSGIHSKLYPGSHRRLPNKRRINGLDGKYNYSLMSSKASSQGLEIRLQALGKKNKLYYQEDLIISK